MCDCNVPLNTKLTYEITVAGARDGELIKLVASTTAPEPAASVPTTNAGTDSAVPLWDIPDPAEVQGIDCGTACASAIGKSEGSGACSMAPLGKPAAPVGLVLITALALGMAVRPRRR